MLGALEVHNAAAGPAGTLRGPRREKEERKKRGLGGWEGCLWSERVTELSSRFGLGRRRKGWYICIEEQKHIGEVRLVDGWQLVVQLRVDEGGKRRGEG